MAQDLAPCSVPTWLWTARDPNPHSPVHWGLPPAPPGLTQVAELSRPETHPLPFPAGTPSAPEAHHMCPLDACKETWLLYWKAGCSLDKTGSWGRKGGHGLPGATAGRVGLPKGKWAELTSAARPAAQMSLR